jgi:hypothetical protein
MILTDYDHPTQSSTGLIRQRYALSPSNCSAVILHSRGHRGAEVCRTNRASPPGRGPDADCELRTALDAFEVDNGYYPKGKMA